MVFPSLKYIPTSKSKHFFLKRKHIYAIFFQQFKDGKQIVFIQKKRSSYPEPRFQYNKISVSDYKRWMATVRPAITMLTMLISLMRMFRDGPEVSLKGSPTVSPTTVAL